MAGRRRQLTLNNQVRHPLNVEVYTPLRGAADRLGNAVHSPSKDNPFFVAGTSLNSHSAKRSLLMF
jgi:hypothetical protein